MGNAWKKSARMKMSLYSYSVSRIPPLPRFTSFILRPLSHYPNIPISIRSLESINPYSYININSREFVSKFIYSLSSPPYAIAPFLLRLFPRRGREASTFIYLYTYTIFLSNVSIYIPSVYIYTLVY